MKLKLILTIIFVLLLNFAGQAQDNPKPEQTKQTQPKLTAKDYTDLLAKLKGGDTNIDYKALRMAFAETEEYSYGGPEKAEREKFLKPFNDKNYKEALKQAEKHLEKNMARHISRAARTVVPRLLGDDLIKQIVLQILSNQRRAPVGDESGRHLGMIDPHRLAPAADVDVGTP